MSRNLRTEIADILTKLPLSYFSRHDLSDLAQTIMADVAAIEHAMSHAMAKAVGFLFFFPLLSVLLLLGNVKLGLAIILPILLGFGLLLLSKNLQIRESFKHYQKLRDNSESFQEAIENQQEIKSFGLTQKIRQTLYQKMEESEKIHLRAEISAGIPMLCSNVILQFAFVLVILIGVQMLHTGEINILYFLGYVLASIKVRESVEAVSMNVAELYYLDSMVKRIREVRETKIQQGKDQTISSYDIEFDQVSFSYDKDTEVLKNISFTAKQNEVTALVGVSTFALDFIHSDRSIFKIVDLDEAWAFLNVAQGETLSNKLVRAGRAMQAGVYFVTQSSGDVSKESLKNNIGLKFAFRSTDINEIKQTLEFFGIDKDDENNQKRLRDLENGQCLLQDLYGRVGVVQIHPVFEELLHAFDTRPPVQRNEVE